MDREYEMKCEIKKCLICNKFIEYSNQLVIVKHNHYHRCCLDKLWLQIEKMERYKIINHYLLEERKINLLLQWLYCDI